MLRVRNVRTGTARMRVATSPRSSPALVVAVNDGVLDVAERYLQFSFPDREQLRLALTAGGAVEGDREGNRTLAQFGSSVVSFIMSRKAFDHGRSRGGSRQRSRRDGC